MFKYEQEGVKSVIGVELKSVGHYTDQADLIRKKDLGCQSGVLKVHCTAAPNPCTVLDHAALSFATISSYPIIASHLYSLRFSVYQSPSEIRHLCQFDINARVTNFNVLCSCHISFTFDPPELRHTPPSSQYHLSS